MSMNTRRLFLKGALFGSAVYGLSRISFAESAGRPVAFQVVKTEAQWREFLTPQQYDVLRDHGTERPHSSPLLKEKREGTFHCAGCDQALYESKTKYESGTGWPSFYQAITQSTGISEDRSWFMVRTEVHCARCGGHLGHIFDDGPQPTGKRHCINGVAMTFKPKAT